MSEQTTGDLAETVRSSISVDTYGRENRIAHDALDALVVRCEQAERERDDYRFWNERVRTCESHTKDVIDGNCLVCALQAAEDRCAALEEALRAIAEHRYQDPQGHAAVYTDLRAIARAALAGKDDS